MKSLTPRDWVYFAFLLVSVSGAFFALQGRVDVLEERLNGQTDTIERIFSSLQRIENKLDNKADK